MTLATLAGLTLGCGPPIDYDARARYPKDDPAAPAPEVLLLSAHLSRFGDAPPTGAALDGPRMAETLESGQDRVVLVFARELDPLAIDPRWFAILRGDGRRVRPIRALLAPANEADENRTLVLLGNFGEPGSAPVAVHVIGPLYAETGEPLTGLDAAISGPEQGDRVVFDERRRPGPARCETSGQVVRLYWSDLIAGVELEDLAKFELALADGQVVAPVGFDDHEALVGAPDGAVFGVRDDNVLDLCVAETAAVVRVRAPAGLFRDERGHPSAAIDTAPRTLSSSEPSQASQ